MQHVRPLRTAQLPDFTGLAEDLEAAWNAPGVTMRARQQLVRALIADIIADVDEGTREVILTIRWQGDSTRNCGYSNQGQANMAVAPLKRRSRSSEACLVDGLTKISPRH
jgi:hypothetical protein